MNLKINNKDYPLQFGIGAIEIYCDKMDCDIDDIDLQIGSPKQIIQLKAINNLALAALQNGCELAGIPFDLNYRQFQQWLDTEPQETAKMIIEEWKKSSMLGVKVSEYYFNEVLPEAEESQNKVTKKKPQSGK